MSQYKCNVLTESKLLQDQLNNIDLVEFIKINQFELMESSNITLIDYCLGYSEVISKLSTTNHNFIILIDNANILPGSKFLKMVKPLKVSQLINLIISLSKKEEQFLIGENIYLNAHKRQIVTTNNSIDLTEKEVNLLVTLINKGKLSKEEILQSVWKYNIETETHTFDTHLSRLKAKLGDQNIIKVENGNYFLNHIYKS